MAEKRESAICSERSELIDASWVGMRPSLSLSGRPRRPQECGRPPAYRSASGGPAPPAPEPTHGRLAPAPPGLLPALLDRPHHRPLSARRQPDELRPQIHRQLAVALPQILGSLSMPAPPVAHRGQRQPQPDRRVHRRPPLLHRLLQGLADHLHDIHPPLVQEVGQQRMRGLATRAAAPPHPDQTLFQLAGPGPASAPPAGTSPTTSAAAGRPGRAASEPLLACPARRTPPPRAGIAISWTRVVMHPNRGPPRRRLLPRGGVPLTDPPILASQGWLHVLPCSRRQVPYSAWPKTVLHASNYVAVNKRGPVPA